MSLETSCIKPGKAPAKHHFKARAVYLMPTGRYARWKAVHMDDTEPVATFVYEARYGGPPPPGLAEAVTLGQRAWGLPVQAK